MSKNICRGLIMHESSLKRMEWFVKNYLENRTETMSILDVGSYDVNGTYKQFFNNEKYRYTGLDMVTGPNVDIAIKHPYQWTEIKNETYDVVISGQALQHAEFFWITVGEMARILKKGGLMTIIAPRGLYGVHRYPVDCYRFDTDGMIALARYCNLEVLHASTNLSPDGDPSWYSPSEDSFLIAKKTLDWSGMLDISTYTCTPYDITKANSNFIPAIPPAPIPLPLHKKIVREIKRIIKQITKL